jgi:hypothetical protein
VCQENGRSGTTTDIRLRGGSSNVRGDCRSLVSRHTNLVPLRNRGIAVDKLPCGAERLLAKKSDCTPPSTILPACRLMSAPKSKEDRILGLDDRRDGAGFAYKLLCVCSYNVRCEITRYGERLGDLVFFDDEEASVTQGERVLRCPGCHNLLGLPGLRS